MSLFRLGFRVLFAAAIAAQLSAPVLAANAKALNLFCPAHAADHRVMDAHAGHSDYASGVPAHARDHSPAPLDESQHERNLFDLSCCSVHLTGVMPFLSVSLASLSGKLQGSVIDDPAASLPEITDPPPRISL